MTGYLAVLPGLFHIAIFIFTLCSACVAITTPTVIVSNKSVKAVSVICFIYCFPGVLIGAIGDALLIKVQTKRSIINPCACFQFLFIFGITLVVKVFQQYPSFRHLSLTFVIFSGLLVFFFIKKPFTCMLVHRIVLNFLILNLFFNSILTTIFTYYERYNFRLLHLAGLVLIFVSLLISLLYQIFIYWKAKKFEYTPENIRNSKISSSVFQGLIGLRQKYVPITPELFDAVREKWPDAIELHLFLFALSISENNTLLKRQDIFSSLSCLSKRSFFNELYFLLTLDIYSKYNDDDSTSLQKFSYIESLETVTELMNRYWNYVLYDNASLSQNVVYEMYLKVERFKKLYSNLSEFEKQFKFFRLPYYMFISKISCEYEQLKDVTISSVEEGVRYYEWIGMDDAEFVNGKFKLNANQFGTTIYHENEPFLNPDKVLLSQRGEKFGHRYTLIEFIIILITIIIPFGISAYMGFLYSRFIYKLDTNRFYEINQFTYVYSAVEQFFWDIFLNKTNNEQVNYESIIRLLNETYTNETNNFKTKTWLKNDSSIQLNFKTLIETARKVVRMLPNYTFEEIVKSDNFTIVTNSLQFLTDKLFHRGYTLIDGYNTMNASYEKSTRRLFLALEIIFGVILIFFIGIHISLYFKFKLLFSQPLLLKKKIVNQILRSNSNSLNNISKRFKSDTPFVNFFTRQLLSHLFSIFCSFFFAFSVAGISLLVTRHIYSRYKFIMACTSLPFLKVATLLTLTATSIAAQENRENRDYMEHLDYYRMECGSILGIEFVKFTKDFNQSGKLAPNYLIYIESPEVLRLTRDKEGARYLVTNSALTELITDSVDVLKNPSLLIPCLKIQATHRQDLETLLFSLEMENSWKWEEGVAYLYSSFTLLFVIFSILTFIFCTKSIIRVHNAVKFFARFINTLPETVPWDDGTSMRCIPFPHETISTLALKAMPVGVFATDRKGIVMSANWAASNFFPESIIVGQPLGELPSQRVLPSGQTQHFKIDTTSARSYIPNVNKSLKITVIKDITTMHALKAEFTRITKQLAVLNDSFFPSSVSTNKDGCTYAESVCSVDVYFSDASDVIENQQFGDKMKEFADRYRTMFSYNNFQWSFNFVFTTYGTFSCDNQHFKDAISFTLHILSERDDVRVGVSGSDGAFVLVNRTTIHGLLVMSPSLPTANALTKYTRAGGVAIDWRVIKMISNSEIEVDTLQKAYIFGREIEYMVFPDGNSLSLFINS